MWLHTSDIQVEQSETCGIAAELQRHKGTHDCNLRTFKWQLLEARAGRILGYQLLWFHCVCRCLLPLDGSGISIYRVIHILVYTSWDTGLCSLRHWASNQAASIIHEEHRNSIREWHFFLIQWCRKICSYFATTIKKSVISFYNNINVASSCVLSHFLKIELN
jgi:hypothetical protein